MRSVPLRMRGKLCNRCPAVLDHPASRFAPKDLPLNRSLSVILPVHNLQSRLSARAGEILEVVAELTDKFELMILDDGSTDATCDVARELVRRYPQVRLLREPIQRGRSLSIRRGLREARGDIVIAHDGEPALDARQIARLWRSLQSPAPGSVWPSTKAIRRSPFATARATRRDVGANSVGPQPSGGFRLLRPGIDPATQNTPRPNYLSRVKSRVRDFTAGE